MNSDPVTIPQDADLSVALEIMGARNIRHIVVVNDSEKVVGIISDRDMAMFYDPIKMTEERWTKSSVKELMSKDPVSIGSAANIEAAAKILIDNGFSGLPVVDSGQLTGFLSEKDFVLYFVRQ